MKVLEIADFLQQSLTFPVIDVRSPAEFENGHIPGAINIPLFNNTERAQVGIRYKNSGKDLAVELGLQIVGPKLYEFVKQAKKKAIRKQVLVHCWRGGMRSKSMAWLFETAGLQAHVLAGGYKAYRKYIRQEFDKAKQLVIVSGYTGSGKTDILKALAQKGEQVVDLEYLASHKGSAFGAIGQPAQPTNEQFENNLAQIWLQLNYNKPIWLEDESRSVGRCVIPENLFYRMRNTNVLRVDIPAIIRVQRLVKEYAHINDDQLAMAIAKQEKYLHGDTKKALEALKEKDYHTAAAISLSYYDRAYLKGLKKRNPETIISISIEKDAPHETAELLMNEYYRKPNI